MKFALTGFTHGVGKLAQPSEQTGENNRRAHADVFSLGAILCEVLTNRRGGLLCVGARRGALGGAPETV